MLSAFCRTAAVGLPTSKMAARHAVKIELLAVLRPLANYSSSCAVAGTGVALEDRRRRVGHGLAGAAALFAACANSRRRTAAAARPRKHGRAPGHAQD